MRRIYLDNNATTPMASEVFDTMKPYFAEHYGNASSIHWFGQQAKSAIEAAREQATALINARPNDLAFTSGGTESDNTSLFGVLEAAQPQGRYEGKHLIVSTVEHHAVLHTAQALEKRGVQVSFVRVGADGIVDPADVEAAIRPETVLISIMHANNELGTIQPLEEIGKISRERDIYFHTDAVQSMGKIPVDVEKLGVDLLSLSAHKFYGPKGTGALYVRKGTNLRPLLYGGHHERDRRPGTENVAGAVGAGKAAELANLNLENEARRIATLRDRLEETILASVPLAHVNGDRTRRLPNTSNIRFDYLDGEGFVIAMDLKGIACSTGAACSSGSVEPSHVLTAIGLSRDQARSSIRFSLGRMTTPEEIDRVIEIVPVVVEQLRAVSPHYKKDRQMTAVSHK